MTHVHMCHLGYVHAVMAKQLPKKPEHTQKSIVLPFPSFPFRIINSFQPKKLRCVLIWTPTLLIPVSFINPFPKKAVVVFQPKIKLELSTSRLV